MIMKKLRAFTIVELVVVMIVSSVTLVTIYTIYLLVKKQSFNQSEKINSLNSFMQFKNTLTSDFFKADSIKEGEENEVLRCYMDKAIAEYKFSGSAVVRDFNNQIDSFVLFPHNVAVSKYANSSIVYYVFFEVVPFKDTVAAGFAKQYDADCLLKIKPE